MEYSIKLDEQQLEAIIALLGRVKNGVPRVVSRAINKVAGHVYAEVIRRVAADTGLKAKWIRRCVRLRRASFRMLRATVKISARKVPLYWFSPRRTKKGVSFKSPPGAEWALDYKSRRHGSRGFVEHAFIQRMPQGHTGVFLREGEPRQKRVGPRWSDLPIMELFVAPLLSITTGTTDMVKQLMAGAHVLLAKEVHTQLHVFIMQEAEKSGALEAKAA